MAQPRLLSGIQPTGDVHIGNYFGAIKQFVDLQGRYDVFAAIVDLHALNQVHNPAELPGNILELAKAYLVAGLDPEKVAIFRQSEVPEHAELCWIFNCITSVGLLERAHAYKDALANGKISNMGLFDYPVLMAADILLYKPDVVPVGKDQQQHLEIMADIGGRFNHLYGQTFKIPGGLILETVGNVPGTDGRKMSKSYKNTIGLFEDPESIAKKVMSIKTNSKSATDPKDPDTDTIFALHKLVTPNLKEVRELYVSGRISYKESKELLLKNLLEFLAPMQEKKAKLKNQDVIDILAAGKEKAQKVARATLEEVKAKVGLNLQP